MTTQSTHELIDHLMCRLIRFEELLRTETNATKRAVYSGWKDGTKQAIADVRAFTPRIEAEARNVPEDESGIEAAHAEPYGSLRERLLAEEMSDAA